MVMEKLTKFVTKSFEKDRSSAPYNCLNISCNPKCSSPLSHIKNENGLSNIHQDETKKTKNWLISDIEKPVDNSGSNGIDLRINSSRSEKSVEDLQDEENCDSKKQKWRKHSPSVEPSILCCAFTSSDKNESKLGDETSSEKNFCIRDNSTSDETDNKICEYSSIYIIRTFFIILGNIVGSYFHMNHNNQNFLNL